MASQCLKGIILILNFVIIYFLDKLIFLVGRTKKSIFEKMIKYPDRALNKAKLNQIFNGFHELSGIEKIILGLNHSVQLFFIQLLSLEKIIDIQFMLAPQLKHSSYGSPNKSTSKQKYCFLMKACSSNELRSPKLQVSEDDDQKATPHKLLKIRDRKIYSLSEKIRIIDGQLNFYKSSHKMLQNDVQYFKSKIKQQFYRTVCLQSQIEIINTSIKNFIIKLMGVFEGNDKSMQSFAKHLQSIKVQNIDYSHIEISKKLLSSLDFQITQLTKSFYVLKKQPETQRNLIRSADFRFQSYQKADELEKNNLRKHISQLIDYYQTKIVDTKDFNEQIEDLRKQREYIKQLLVNSQRQKNGFVNEVYQVARRDYKIDFERMTRSEVVKLCLTLLGRLRQLQSDKSQLERQIKILENSQKGKYQNMLRQVKKIQKQTEPKLSLKRLNSMPLN